MVGLVVATHGKLAEELLRTAEGIVGALAPPAIEACAAVTSGSCGPGCGAAPRRG